MSNDLIIRQFNDIAIGQRADGFLNATAMCKASGKLFADYDRLASSREFREELARSMGIPIDVLAVSVVNGPNNQRGTWVHSHVAYHLAQWCSPAFAVQVTEWIHDIRTKGYATAPGVEIDESHKATPAVDLMQALNDPATLRTLLLNNTEKLLAAEAVIQEQAPTVAAFERIAKAEGAMCITDAGKVLQMNRNAIFQYLREKRWIYSRPGKAGHLAYQDRIRAGCLEHKVHVYQGKDGRDKTREQVLVTAKGFTALARMLEDEKRGSASTTRQDDLFCPSVH